MWMYTTFVRSRIPRSKHMTISWLFLHIAKWPHFGGPLTTLLLSHMCAYQYSTRLKGTLLQLSGALSLSGPALSSTIPFPSNSSH